MNLSRLEKLLHDFYQISGLEIAIIDTKYRQVLSHRHIGRHFCNTIHACPECVELCRSSDLAQMRRAAVLKEAFTYTCPFGIFAALAPIMREGEVIGFLTFAMAMEAGEEKNEFPIQMALSIAPSLDSTYLQSCVNELPRYSKEQLQSYAALLPLMAEHIEKHGLLSDSEQTVGQLVCRYVEKNLSHKITLADLAWQLHCSTVTLTEHFKREYGITIMQYVLQKRMEKADRMLREEETTVTQTADRCGFSDVEYFSRTFKQYYGVSPSSYQKQHKKR